MPSSRRCVFGCVTKGLTVHNFPNPVKFPEQFKAWVDLCGEQLKNLAVEDIYPRMKVCDRHFIGSHRNRNNRLSALAIPTLHIPYLHLDPEPPTGTCEIVPTKDNVTVMAIDMSVLSLDQGSTEVEHETPQIESSVSSEHSSGLHAVQKTFLEDHHSRSAEHCITPEEIVSSAAPCQSDAVVGVLNDHDYCTFGTEKSILKKTMTKRVRGSSKKSLNVAYYKATQKKTKNLQREIFRLRKRCISFKSRLDAASKLSDSAAFQRVTAEMSLPARLFTTMQYREAKKKPKGRRFTLEEKILSLSFYKRSPKAYPLLHKSFTLPSSKSLRNLLGKIKIGQGLIISFLKK